ncbi:hypothetical protein FIU86_20500 (plasmid) [Roseovarius sp. THAF9]|uniref:hypothetical protein n=1 Tax=Roseovarius sp. THAF9 TaxID=2587847 RepID=UPI0012A9D533|nr:hypothetical protein [Roseovarius sp. THAF9]QFT95243.1 hypothetical protein FIU86_20500 [Roseovarius sp. THAF9]
MSLLLLRLMATGLVCLTAEAASAEALEIDISVLDPESFALDPPTGDTRWVIESTGDFLLAEQHGAVPSMRFDLPPGQYRVTVWEMGSDAAAEQSVTIRNGETVRAALTLSPLNSALIARTRARTSRPAPDPTADAQTAPAPSRPSQTERSEATGQQAKRTAMPLGIAVRPADAIEITLPEVPDAANDRVALSDGGPGWIWWSERGSVDVMALNAPETTGAYMVQYVQVPEMTVLMELELRVR